MSMNKRARPNPFIGIGDAVSSLDPFGNDRMGAVERERDEWRRRAQEEGKTSQNLREQLAVSTMNTIAVPEMQRKIESLEMRNTGLEEFIEELKEKPQVVVTVQRRIDEKFGLITFQGSAMRVKLPEESNAGDQVMVLTDTGQPIDVAKEPLAFGGIVTVARVEGGRCFFEGNGGEQVSAYLKHKLAVAEGDRVQLDPSGTVALQNLGRDKTRFSIEQCPDVKWDDIGGHTEAKEAFREALEYPTLYKDTYAAYGAPSSKGVLLYGPPGTGKTLLAKAAANSVSKDGRGGFIYVKGPEVLSKWVGEAETTIRTLFQRARAHKLETGHMAVIFIDEADALLGVRGGKNSMTSTLVPSFLAEMDGIEESGAFMVLATNRPDSLDPAVVRDGRIDRRIRIGRPDRDSAVEILKLQLRGRLLQKFSPENVIDHIWHDQHALYEMDFGTLSVQIGLSDMLSGAVIAGFVTRASRLAIKRDRDTKKPLGISEEDMLRAVSDSFTELASVNPNDLFLEKADIYGNPTSIKKVTYDARAKAKEVGRPVVWRS